MPINRYITVNPQHLNPPNKWRVLVLYCLVNRNCLFTRPPGVKKPAYTGYKNGQLKNRLIQITPLGKALCLLKTQFAKKPKNPV